MVGEDINVGSRPRLRCAVFDETASPRALSDPSSLSVTIYHRRSGRKVSLAYPADPEVVREGVGAFYVDHTVDAPGEWVIRWEASGGVTEAGELVLNVPPSRIP